MRDFIRLNLVNGCGEPAPPDDCMVEVIAWSPDRCLAIHAAHDAPGFSVTHAASGLRLARAESLTRAENVLRALERFDMAFRTVEEWLRLDRVAVRAAVVGAGGIAG